MRLYQFLGHSLKKILDFVCDDLPRLEDSSLLFSFSHAWLRDQFCHNLRTSKDTTFSLLDIWNWGLEPSMGGVTQVPTRTVLCCLYCAFPYSFHIYSLHQVRMLEATYLHHINLTSSRILFILLCHCLTFFLTGLLQEKKS